MKVSHRRPAALDQFYYGAAYYPEHWDRSMWENDARRMADAGFNAVRLGEFAWQLMEPEEGRYDFSLFDDAIEIIAAHGLKVIMCTPTAAPPRRLTATWPDMLRVDADGRPMLHGSRQHACHSSPRFRDYSRRITQAMADHFRDCHDVVGWQTDNEIHCHFSECHCPSCQSAFRHFLKAKYGSIDRLNRAWGTVFWSLTFDDFDQIETPRPNRPTFGNPSHELDYRRFLSCAAADFQRDQLEILRAAGRPWFTFHNGVMANLDYRGPFGQELDVLGFDVYPFFEFDPAKRRENHAFSLDRVRSLTGNFIIPEHQSGPGGQATYFHDNPEPGELRKLCYVSLARGGDSLLYFRWRTCRFGAEEYWCGVIDHDDVPRRRYREVAELGRDLATLGPWLRGTHVAIDCAVATGDYDSDTAHRLYPLGLPAPGVIAKAIHCQLYHLGYEIGCVYPEDDLDGIKLYIIPHWEIIRDEWLPRLEEYVRTGGTLVIGARCGTRTPENQITCATFPGNLAALTGITVEEYGRETPEAGRERELVTPHGRVTSECWYETLHLGDAQPYARWDSRFVAGQVAISQRPLGKGQIFYVGTYLTPRVCDRLLPEFAGLAGLVPSGLPPQIESVRRLGDSGQLRFLINHADHEVKLESLPPGELLIGENRPEFAAYEVKVIKS